MMVPEEATAAVDSRTESTSTIERFDEDTEIPPISTVLNGWAYWCKFFTWPVLFILFNAIAFTTLVSFNEYMFDHHDENSYSRMLGYNAMVIAVLSLLDAFPMYRGARYLEKEVAVMDTVEESTDARSHVHAHLSRKVDGLLKPGWQPRVSIFVSLLLIASVVSCAVGMSMAVFWGVGWTKLGKSWCSKLEHSRHDPIDGIPDELQTWATNQGEMLYDQDKIDLVHMTDGVNYLVGQDPRNQSSLWWQSL
jgi:hypothetical protein